MAELVGRVAAADEHDALRQRRQFEELIASGEVAAVWIGRQAATRAAMVSATFQVFMSATRSPSFNQKTTNFT